ncbi:MAG: serine hydrolase domain-containing protein [Pseudomonadota bacterium]
MSTAAKIAGAALAAWLTACGMLSHSELDISDAEARRYAKTRNLRAEVDSLARPLVEQGKTPGLVVGVLLPGGRRHFFGYGVADKLSGIQPDGDTAFPIGSLSKGFLGGLAALLVQEGVLSWDDTLATRLPNENLDPQGPGKISLRRLATHTSGLPRQPFPPRTLLYFIAYLFNGENFYRQFDREYIFGYLRDFDPPEGNQVVYSNIGYALLGQALEQRTGQSVASLVHRKIIGPLKLDKTRYAFEQLPAGSVRAHGHAGDQPRFIARGAPVPDWRFNDFMNTSTGMISSARDLLGFASAHFNDNRLGKALRSTLKPVMNLPVRSPAVAWVVDDLAGQKIAYQVGFVAGYSSYLGLDVERQTAVVVLQNSFNFDDQVGHRLLHRLALKKAPPAS